MTRIYYTSLLLSSTLLQYMSEKIGGAKGTELDEDYMEMERVST